MKTICTNPECLQTYNVKPEALNKLVRCKKCNSIFKIEPYEELVNSSKILIEDVTNNDTENISDSEASSNSSATSDSTDPEAVQPDTTSKSGGTKKKTNKEIIEAKAQVIQLEIKKIIPLLFAAYERQENESGTRVLINKILEDVLGYTFKDNIKTEQKINGKLADYVLSINNEDIIVIEAKAIKTSLKEKHIYQATTYGAYAGIKWVVLTNGLVWMLYRISTGEKISHDLVFTVDLLDGLDDEEAKYLYLISYDGMCRGRLLENLWQKIWALSPENLTVALLSDDVISKVRTTLTKQTGYKATNEEIRQILEEKMLELS